MENFNIQIYQQLIGYVGLAGAAYLFTSEQTDRALAAAGIALIALADAYTWTRPGILPAKLFSLLTLLDVVGVLAALVALIATGLLAPGDAAACSLSKSISAAVVYILCCLAFWLLLPVMDPEHYQSLKTVTNISDHDRWKYVALFVVSAAVLIAVMLRWPPTTGLTGNWKPFTCAVWAYLLVYLVLVTFPLLRDADNRRDRFKKLFEETSVAKSNGFKCLKIEFSKDEQKARISFTAAGSPHTNEAILEHDGFQGYTGILNWQTNTTNTTVTLRKL